MYRYAEVLVTSSPVQGVKDRMPGGKTKTRERECPCLYPMYPVPPVRPDAETHQLPFKPKLSALTRLCGSFERGWVKRDWGVSGLCGAE
jgi:hypothetical protein